MNSFSNARDFRHKDMKILVGLKFLMPCVTGCIYICILLFVKESLELKCTKV